MNAGDAVMEDHHGEAIGRASWKRLTARALRRTGRQEVAAEVGGAEMTGSRATGSRQRNYRIPVGQRRPFRDGGAPPDDQPVTIETLAVHRDRNGGLVVSSDAT